MSLRFHTFLTGLLALLLAALFAFGTAEAKTAPSGTPLSDGVVSGNIDVGKILGEATFAAVSAGLVDKINLSTFGGSLEGVEWANTSAFQVAGLGFGNNLTVAKLVEAGIDATLTAGLSSAVHGTDFLDSFAASMRSSAINLAMADLQSGIGDGLEKGWYTEGDLSHAALHGLVGCAAGEALGGNCASGFAAGVAQSVYAGMLDGTGPDKSDIEAHNAWRAQVANQAELIGASVGYLTSGGLAANVSGGGSIARSGAVHNYLSHTQRTRVEELIRALGSCQATEACSAFAYDAMISELQLLEDASTAQTVAMVAACINGPSPECAAHVAAAEGFEEWAWSSPYNELGRSIGVAPSDFQAEAQGGDYNVDHNFNLELIALDFAREVQSGEIAAADAADVFDSRMQAYDGRTKVVVGVGQALSAGACYGTKVTCVLGILNAAVGLDRAYEGTVTVITGEDQLSAIESGLVNLAGYDDAAAKALRDDIETGVAIVTVVTGGGIVIYKGGQAIAQLRHVNPSNRAFAFTSSGEGNDLRRFAKVDGTDVRINSGHAYRQSHAGGDVTQIGTMDEIENAILQDIARNSRLESLQPRTTQTHTVQVNGQTLGYSLADTPVGANINYYPMIE